MPADTAATSVGPDADGVVRVRGPLTFSSVPAMATEAPRWLTAGRLAEVDLGEVTRVDSAGLALMLDWMAHAGSVGAGLRFISAPAQLLAIARASGLVDLFDGDGDAPPEPEA